MKPAEFCAAAEAKAWDFIRSLDYSQLREVETCRGIGWSKFLVKNTACTFIVMCMSDGIVMSTFTDLNPTVLEKDYYTFSAEDDHARVLEQFGEYLNLAWSQSLARPRHTKLFGAAWPAQET